MPSATVCRRRARAMRTARRVSSCCDWRGATSTLSYRWTELGGQQRRTLMLDNAAKDDPRRCTVWRAAAAHRGEALPLPAPVDPAGGPAGFLLHGALFYSRPCKNCRLSEQERDRKAVDYFVLTRDPEFDPTTGKRTADIDGSCITSAHPDIDPFRGEFIVGFALNPQGAELLGVLTRKNVSERGPGGVGPAPTWGSFSMSS